MPTKRKKTNVKSKAKLTHVFTGLLKAFLIRSAVIVAVVFLAYVAYLDIHVKQKFEGQKWALPAHVYTRPLELYIGQQLDIELLTDELAELGYQSRDHVDRVGTYRLSKNKIELYQRQFMFWDGLQQEQLVSIKLRDNLIDDISVKVEGSEQLVTTEIVRLEPRLFGSVSPMSHEDRSLLKIEKVPQALIDALIAIEDRKFFSHFGVNPLGILRAMVRNASAGKVVQGGSTLTQQLIKNYYLTSERTIKRKLNEIVMAVLLEIHYSKQEILQAYLNEVHLSQSGNRAIHGFALGSQYFFGRPIQELELQDYALLAGIIKGSSYYNPFRHPQRALNRRDLVLGAMLHENFIDTAEYEAAIDAPLNVTSGEESSSPLSYPSFLGLVRDDLKQGYQQEDLGNEGLNIYTTLNPRIQNTLESVVSKELNKIEKDRKIEANSLQTAAVVVRTDNGEVVAMLGDRQASFSGYNRALKNQRPIGSLIKPFLYLTALAQPDSYSLATRIKDQAITVSQNGSEDWKPRNYDNKEHGKVMLIDALSRSYNLAAVQLGMEVGVKNVIHTFKQMGFSRDITELPSVLLGSVDMNVLEVAQNYLTLASNGFNMPLKSVRSVLSNHNEQLARFPLSINQAVDPEYVSLINYALQDVVNNGTARSLKSYFKTDYGLAGKTGTTNNYRDSWFAGFSGNYLMVVWVGRDDNQSTRLTGANGAGRIWARTMQKLPLTSLDLSYNEELTTQTVTSTSISAISKCDLTREFPVARRSLPLENLPCPQYKPAIERRINENKTNSKAERKKRQKKKRKSWLERIFG